MRALVGIFDPPARVGQPSAFFAALDRADARLREVDRAESAALAAPPIKTSATCSCGSTLEIRDSQIQITDEERSEAMADIADFLGRGPDEDLDRAIVDRVISAIDTARCREDYGVLADFYADHSYCDTDGGSVR